MADETSFSFDGRRYSAVVVSHQTLRSFDDLRTRVDGIEPVRARPTLDDEGHTAWRVDWLSRQNHYPYGSTLRKSARQQRGDGRYRHRCLIAAIASADSAATPRFVFASPHIRVVGAWCATLEDLLDHPRPQYAVPRLDALFHALGTSSTAYKATQITLQIPSGVDVEKVALTGKSPLISSLRATLAPVTRPYAVRLEMPREGRRPLRLHLDRHGNCWWHQANDRAFGVAAHALASLGSDGYLGFTHDLPTKRIVSEDGFS
jgi:hypothetical protein